MHPIYDHVPDMVLKEDDIVFVDLGPVFGDIEADFARTYVLGKHTSSCTCCQHDTATVLTVRSSGAICTAVSNHIHLQAWLQFVEPLMPT